MIISVDVFFFSSGCLTTYLYLKDKTNEILIKSIDCRQKLIELFIHIIKRFIRYVFFRLFDLYEQQFNNRNKIIALISKSKKI